MSKIVVNNIELTLNLLDADVMEKYEIAVKAMQDAYKDISRHTDLPASQILRRQCSICETFIDKLFGEGTSCKLFDGSSDLMTHFDVLGKITAMANDSRDQLLSVSEKYGVARLANREQHRNAGVTVVNGGKQHGHYNGKKRHH